MGTYTTIQFKNRKVANQFNKILGLDLANTIDLICEDYINLKTQDEICEKSNFETEFENSFGLKFTFKNYVKTYGVTFNNLNSLSIKISSYEEEELYLWKKIYDTVFQFKDGVKEVDNWEEFCNILDVNTGPFVDKPPFEPEKLPHHEQMLYNSQDYINGISVCPPLKTWGINKVNVLFGNVAEPKFIRTKEYKDDLYNSFVKDKNGNSYVMIPQLTLSYNARNEVKAIFEKLYQMTIREESFMFINLVFPSMAAELGTADKNQVIAFWAEFYPKEMLAERLEWAKNNQEIYKKVYDNKRDSQFVYMLQKALTKI